MTTNNRKSQGPGGQYRRAYLAWLDGGRRGPQPSWENLGLKKSTARNIRKRENRRRRAQAVARHIPV